MRISKNSKSSLYIVEIGICRVTTQKNDYISLPNGEENELFFFY